MKAILETTKVTETEVTHDVLSVLMTIVSAASVIIGVWAFACIVGALFSHGLAGVIKGYITAVTGL